MATNTYANINGTWVRVKKIWQNDNGVWRDTVNGYINHDGWRLIHKKEYNFTFTYSITASAYTGIPLQNYVNPAWADIFNIYVNPGVVLSGYNGGNGGDGAAGVPVQVGVYINSGNIASFKVTNCHSSAIGNGGNGGTGGNGGIGIDFTGFGGKIINIINSGTIKGGDGGAGGNGGAPGAAISGTTRNGLSGTWTQYGGCGGAGGAGGGWGYNPSAATINFSVHGPFNGLQGGAGVHGIPSSTLWSVQYRCSQDCFLIGQKVLKADGTFVNNEHVQIGDLLQGGYGPDDINEVTHIEKSMTQREIWNINGMKVTPNHALLNGNRDGFKFASLGDHELETNQYQMVFNRDNTVSRVMWDGGSRDTLKEPLKIGDTIMGINGPEKVTVMEKYKGPGEVVYNFVLKGKSRTYNVAGYYVSGFISDEKFNYNNGEER